MNEQLSTFKPQISAPAKSALIAMSGGVDSAVAAVLTRRDGLDCAGATMRLYKSASADGSETCKLLGIDFYTFNFEECFSMQVIEPFIKDYREGRTPNPCVVCNKHIKFGEFLKKAREIGKDCIVTGHYAQVECNAAGRYLLKKGTDKTKDQSYVLYTLTQEQLAQIRFPLGGLTKSQVREIAQSAGLKNASSGESQDICFIPDGDYARFITDYIGEVPKKGKFVDTEGNYLGENKGIVSYTIGQRRGLGIAAPHPLYVLELHPEDDTVIVGRKEQLYSKTLYANKVNLIPLDKLDAPLRAQVKIRYTDPGHIATVHQTDEDTIRIEFDEPQRAITKGQAAVIYDGDTVIGGATIV